MDRIRFPLRQDPFDATASDEPLIYSYIDVELSKRWVQKAITMKLYEHRRAEYGIEPTGIVLDPKTAVQLSWELTGRYSGVGEIFGLPIHLGVGTDRIELLFDDRAVPWLLAKKN